MLLYHFGYGTYGPGRRGKRLRPQIVLRTALGLGAPPEAAVDAAVAVEILHNYSLIHDDIEDRDELRHGRETLWSRYGVAQAINAGDALCALSFLTLLRSSRCLPDDRVLAMTATLHEAHRVMCNGQSLDLEFESAAQVSLDRYHHMIAGKTAALFEAACFLGAQSALADPSTIERCGRLGRAFGVAFQICDDIDGIWASSERTGKVVANDIARRKWTYPIVWALEAPPSPARDLVAAAYSGGSHVGPADVARVVAALDELGAREAAWRAAAEPMAVVEGHSDLALREYLLGTFGGLQPRER